MTSIFWKPLVGVDNSGGLYIDDTFAKYEGLRLLGKIVNMKCGIPISLEAARRKQLNAAFFSKIVTETPASVVKRSNWIQLNLVEFMEELGYQIRLKGDEYSVIQEDSVTSAA